MGLFEWSLWRKKTYLASIIMQISSKIHIMRETV